MTGEHLLAAVDGDAAVGVAVRAALGGRLPWIAVQTAFSALHGTVTPRRWAAALTGLAGTAVADVERDRRGANHPASGAAVARSARACQAVLAGAQPVPPPAARGQPSVAGPPWAALADVGDLAGLPACLDAWGRRVAVGATVPLAAAGADPTLALVLAPDPAAYRRLCRLLSWRHEHAAPWQAWMEGRVENGPLWDGLVVLVQDAGWAGRLAWHGAEVWWRLPGPPAPPGVPEAAVPILTDIDGSGAPAAALLHRIQERSRVRAHVEAARGRIAPCALADLPRLMAGVSDAAIAHGHALAQRCRHAPGAPGADGQPRWQMPPCARADPAGELRRRCQEGLRLRYGETPPSEVAGRLAYELGVIMRKDFAGYILAVADITAGRRTCGRGSAASSLVCYLLGITNVDPLRYRLVFERFLSDERTDPPDIDIDFPWDERDAVLAGVIASYGEERVALVAAHQTLRRDGARRDAARVLGRDRAALTAAIRRSDLAERHDVGPGAGADWNHVLAAAGRIEGLMRGCGLHCGGVVITSDPIRDLVPLHPAAKTVAGRPLPAIAWEKDGAEAMGLVKLDLLGNRSLAVVRDVLDDLRAQGVSIDLWRWTPDRDPLTSALVAQARTIGCFYIESPAMRQLIGRCGRIDFDQLVLLSSIVRPAAYHWIGTYLERLHDFRRSGRHRDEWYPHPALRGLLSESFGVLSYQEDVMLSARDLAGFGIARQNQLRKALGRSDTPQRLAGLAGAFRDGCRERGVDPAVIDLVWSNIVSFAGYSFCKAHSASYAMVSYACAYLKAHHAAAFMARVIHNRGGFYGVGVYVEEARRLGVAIRAPCVVHGGVETQGEDHGVALRLGLELVKGMHGRTQAAIVRERARLPFAGVRDFWRRCRPTTGEFAALHAAGALTALMSARSAGERDWLVAAVSGEPRPEADHEDQLRFDFAPATCADPPPPTALPAPTQRDLDRRAWTILGCLPRAHPFARWDLPGRRVRCGDIGPQHAGRLVTLLVWVITCKPVEAVQERGRDGAPLSDPLVRAMAFATLEDETGTLESTWFPEAYRTCGALIGAGCPFWVQGTGAVDHGVIGLEVARAWCEPASAR